MFLRRRHLARVDASVVTACYLTVRSFTYVLRLSRWTWWRVIWVSASAVRVRMRGGGPPPPPCGGTGRWRRCRSLSSSSSHMDVAQQPNLIILNSTLVTRSGRPARFAPWGFRFYLVVIREDVVASIAELKPPKATNSHTPPSLSS